MDAESAKKEAVQQRIRAAAERARKEAEERREKAAKNTESDKPPEVGGGSGPDPARYGDWEVKGIASDF